MKKTLLPILTAILFFAVCDKSAVDTEDDEFVFEIGTQLRATSCGHNEDTDIMCGMISYAGNYGDNFDSALEALINEVFEPWLADPFVTPVLLYSGQGYYIEEVIIDVDFDYDDRTFVLLRFIDKSDNKRINAHGVYGNIIDSKGNWFRYVFPPD